MPAPNNPASLGLYIAYSALSGYATSNELFHSVTSLRDSLANIVTFRALPPIEKKFWAKTMSSVLFLLYILSSYQQTVKNKKLIEENVQLIREHVALLKSLQASLQPKKQSLISLGTCIYAQKYCNYCQWEGHRPARKQSFAFTA